MPEHIFTVVARGHSIDAQTNQVTLFGVVEAVGASALPVVVPELAIVTLWCRSDGDEGAEFVHRVRVLGPAGDELTAFEAQFRFDKPRMRMVGQLRACRFEREGRYHVEITVRPVDQPNAWSPPCALFPIEVQLADSHKGEGLFHDND